MPEDADKIAVGCAEACRGVQLISEQYAEFDPVHAEEYRREAREFIGRTAPQTVAEPVSRGAESTELRARWAERVRGSKEL